MNDKLLLETIEQESRKLISHIVFDQFVYYEENRSQNFPLRINCLDIAISLKKELEKSLSDKILVKIIPFEANIFGEEQKEIYGYAHVALFVVLKNRGNILGIVDPSYGIFSPLWKNNFVDGNGYEWRIVSQKSGYFLLGKKSQKQICERFYNDIELKEGDYQRHQDFLKSYLPTCYAYLLSPCNGKKEVKIEIMGNELFLKKKDGVILKEIVGTIGFDRAIEIFANEVTEILCSRGVKGVLSVKQFRKSVDAYLLYVSSHSTKQKH